MKIAKLKHAPLKEVVFELYWECDIDNSGIQTDSGYDLAQGVFANKLKSQFPIHRKLLPEGSPLKIIKAPLHQYWKGELLWPVVQHGQGMIAINEVEGGYEWKNRYEPLLINVIKLLIDSYEDPLKFNRVKLQYVDAIDMENEVNPFDFMANNLQTQLISNYELPGKQKNFNIQQTFELKDLSQMHLSISDGINNQNNKKSIVWTTSVEKKALMDLESLIKWIDVAHSTTSEMFKRMLNPEFYASLNK